MAFRKLGHLYPRQDEPHCASTPTALRTPEPFEPPHYTSNHTLLRTPRQRDISNPVTSNPRTFQTPLLRTPKHFEPRYFEHQNISNPVTSNTKTFRTPLLRTPNRFEPRSISNPVTIRTLDIFEPCVTSNARDTANPMPLRSR